MSWKIILGKPGDTNIIGKRWLKKNIPKSKRLPKEMYKKLCSGYIYNIGLHYLPEEPEKLQELWICYETGRVFKKEDIIEYLQTQRKKLNHSIQ